MLWQPEKGFYLTHAHVTPLQHKFDESAMVSISNALAVYTGLTDPQQTAAAFSNLERARINAGVSKPGLSLYPFYPNIWPDLFFEYPGMGYGNYQNGAVWDWWGGVQIKAEFLTGHSETARTHLMQVANDWQKHPGNIIEWQSSTDQRHEGSHYYSAAAGTMGSAIIEGLFGVTLTGQGLTLQPRLGLNDGYIRTYQAATDRYAAYSYDWGQDVTNLSYGTNAGGMITVKLLKLRSEQISKVIVDGRPIEYHTETIGNDTYTVFATPSGQHNVEIVKGVPPVINTAAEPAPEAAINPIQAAAPSIARNAIGAPPPTVDEVDSSINEVYSAGLIRNNPLTIRYARESRLALIQFASVILVVLTSLALIGLAVIRRFTGLSYNASKNSKR